MFRVKAKTKPGMCAAMRCKEPATADGGASGALCDRHAAERAQGGEVVPTASVPKSAVLALPDADAFRLEIEPTRTNLTQTLEMASALPLDTQAALDGMGQIRSFATQARDWLDGRRKTLKAPSLEAGRRIDDAAKPALDLAKAVIECVDTRLKAFRADVREAQDAALAQSATPTRPETLVAVRGGELELPEQVTTRQVLRVRTIGVDGQPCDFAKSATPREFGMLNEELALEYARHRGYDKCQVPGLQFYFEETIVKARGSA